MRFVLVFENERLPEGWVRTKIQNITDVIRGASPRPKGDPRYFGGSIPWIMISDITREKGKFLSITKYHVTEEGAKKSKLLKKGSLILSNSGTVCIPKILNVSGCIHDGFVTFPTLNKNINIFYAYYWFENIRPKIIHDNKQGVTQVNLNTTIVKNIEMLIPPLSEQHHIVSKIESIFAQIDATKQQLELLASQVATASDNLVQLKSSVLKQAFEGRLVSQNPNDETAEILLNRLHKNSEKELEFDKEGLPEGWIFLPFGNIKPSTKRFDPIKEENRRYVGLEHIEKDTGRIIGSRESKTAVSLKTIFCKGDLLYGKLRPYLNKVVVADFDGVCSTDILVFQQNPFIANIFLKLCLLKSDFVEFANSTVTGVQHPRTSHKKLSDYPIPLPPLSEQHRIISKIESIFGKIDAEFVILKITYSVMIFVFLHLYARTAVFFDYLDPCSISSKHGSK